MIKTKRCSLTTLNKSDYTDVKRLYMNERVRQYLGGATNDEAFLKSKFTEVLEQSNLESSKYWAVRLITSDEFIGIVYLGKYHNGDDTEVSYQFLPEYWNLGLAREAVTAVINFAFVELGLPELIAETQTANKRSCGLLERLGMSLENKIIRFDAEQSVYSIRNLKVTQ